MRKTKRITSRPLNIAFLGHKRIPSREGGVEIVVEELAVRMAAEGHNVTCYNRGGHHVSGHQFDGEELTEYRGVKLKKVPTFEGKGLAAFSASVLASFAIAFGKYDLVYYHAEGSCAMLWLPKLFGKTCIATVHGLDWDREKWKGSFGAKYIKFGEKVAVKYADEIIVLSRNCQNYFREVYGRETHFISNGVERMERYEAVEIQEKYGLTDRSYVLFLGRLVPEKGLRYLIQAFKQVKTDKKLVIVGGSSDTDKFMAELKEMAAEDDRILFTGFVQGRVLHEMYSNCYLYTLPSDLEGMPLSLLEAMSYGNCCLTSDIPECAEVVEDKAVTFPRGNVDALREKLQMLCDDPALVERYRSESVEHICKKSGWDDVASKTLELYTG